MTTIAELKQEIKERALDVAIAQGRLGAAQYQLRVLEAAKREAKQAKCKHTYVTRWDRTFEGEGFYDTEYQYCPKCKLAQEYKTVNVVLKSEK